MNVTENYKFFGLQLLTNNSVKFIGCTYHDLYHTSRSILSSKNVCILSSEYIDLTFELSVSHPRYTFIVS